MLKQLFFMGMMLVTAKLYAEGDFQKSYLPDCGCYLSENTDNSNFETLLEVYKARKELEAVVQKYEQRIEDLKKDIPVTVRFEIFYSYRDTQNADKISQVLKTKLDEEFQNLYPGSIVTKSAANTEDYKYLIELKTRYLLVKKNDPFELSKKLAVKYAQEDFSGSWIMPVKPARNYF